MIMPLTHNILRVISDGRRIGCMDRGVSSPTNSRQPRRAGGGIFDCRANREVISVPFLNAIINSLILQLLANTETTVLFPHGFQNIRVQNFKAHVRIPLVCVSIRAIAVADQTALGCARYGKTKVRQGIHYYKYCGDIFVGLWRRIRSRAGFLRVLSGTWKGQRLARHIRKITYC